jgi:hypothetical protein
VVLATSLTFFLVSFVDRSAAQEALPKRESAAVEAVADVLPQRMLVGAPDRLLAQQVDPAIERLIEDTLLRPGLALGPAHGAQDQVSGEAIGRAYALAFA